MRSCIFCVHIETSSLWAEFLNKRRFKALNFGNFDNSHNSFLWPEYFIDFFMWKWIPCQGVTSVLCLHYRPETVHCSTKVEYTSEITFLVLHPWFCQYFQFWTILEYVHHNAAKEIESLPQTQISKPLICQTWIMRSKRVFSERNEK